jgi:hypothetical protein
MTAPTPVPASDVYVVVGEDRTASTVARAARWLGTAVVGLFDVGGGSAPSMSDVVIRLRVNDSEVRRIQPADVEEFEETLALARTDLAQLDAVDFADAWLD